MTEAVQSNAIQPNRVQGLLVAAGVLLLGLAALIIAFQWQTRTTITVDTPASEAAKVGFEIVPAVKRGLGGNEPQQYLLDKDSGRIWAESYGGEWKEVKVEGITPSSSQANYR